MKRVKFILTGLSLFLISGAFFPAGNNTVTINGSGKMPNWVWTSGEVKQGNYAAKECVTIVFYGGYHPNDKVRITFNSFKVALTNLTKGTTFHKWSAKTNLVYYMGKTWLPLVKDTNDRINQPFTGRNNNTVDSLTDYSFKTTVPPNKVLIITVEPSGAQFDTIQGPNAPIFAGGKGYPTFTTSIKGLEVEKIAAK